MKSNVELLQQLTHITNTTNFNLLPVHLFTVISTSYAMLNTSTSLTCKNAQIIQLHTVSSYYTVCNVCFRCLRNSSAFFFNVSYVHTLIL